MDGGWQYIGQLCKRGLAAVLFCLLVVGASAAALTAVAAGIRTLSAATSPQAVPATSGWPGAAGRRADASYGDAGGTPAVPGEGQWGTDTASGLGMGPSAAGSGVGATGGWSRAYSPVTHALDAGGVALGLRVQNAFGHLLSGVLQTLFFEQIDSPVDHFTGAGSGISGSAEGTVAGSRSGAAVVNRPGGQG
ncbi:MAG: hypothetical protein K6T26_03510 [Alicyclobacillus sp.]|nr:hypothetical protein [Alicyclobacillus sp.]